MTTFIILVLILFVLLVLIVIGIVLGNYHLYKDINKFYRDIIIDKEIKRITWNFKQRGIRYEQTDYF